MVLKKLMKAATQIDYLKLSTLLQMATFSISYTIITKSLIKTNTVINRSDVYQTWIILNMIMETFTTVWAIDGKVLFWVIWQICYNFQMLTKSCITESILIVVSLIFNQLRTPFLNITYIWIQTWNRQAERQIAFLIVLVAGVVS